MTERNKFLIKIIIAGAIFILSGKMIYDRLMIYLYKDTVEITEIKAPSTEETKTSEAKTMEVKTETKTVENIQQPQNAQSEQPKLHKVTIKYQTKKAKKVKLNGSFFGWKERDMKKENGDWIMELTIKDPGEYKYYFIVDGKKVLDPKAKKSKDGAFSLLEIK
ncbi:MAG: hypothetical protein AB1602_07685 [Elusimicrobiota bacterium]